MIKMTKRAYLEARGWLYRYDSDDEKAEPQFADTEGAANRCLGLAKAVSVQQSRDAKEERAVYAQALSTALTMQLDPHMTPFEAGVAIRVAADVALYLYKDKFAVELSD